MIDYAIVSNTGGRTYNEDFVMVSEHDCDRCFVVCDGLGGHKLGAFASRAVSETISEMFERGGDYPAFLADAINAAQNKLLTLQNDKDRHNDMKTTLVVLVVTEEMIKWAHIGDSRLYHIFDSGKQYERTKDHSYVQYLCDRGTIEEKDIRNHPERNKLLRVMGAEWEKKSFELSPMLERDESSQAFALMTDGFWEYIDEEQLMQMYRESSSAKEWLNKMIYHIENHADLSSIDNYSAILVRVDKDE